MTVEILLFTRQHRNLIHTLTETLKKGGMQVNDFKYYLRTLRHSYTTAQNGKTYQSDFYVGLFSDKMYDILDRAGFTSLPAAGGIEGYRLSKYNLSKVRVPEAGRDTNMVIHFDSAFDYRIKEWTVALVTQQLTQLHRLGYLTELPKVLVRRYHCGEINARFIKILFGPEENYDHILFTHVLLSNTPVVRPFELREDPTVSGYPLVLSNNLRVAWMMTKPSREDPEDKDGEVEYQTDEEEN